MVKAIKATKTSTQSWNIRKWGRKMERPGTERRRRLVLVPCPFQGHITPMLQLATILHSKGFSITIAHPEYNSPDPSNHPDFVFQPLKDNLSSNTVPWTAITFLEAVNTDCKAPFHEFITNLVDKQDSLDQVAGIIHDNHMYFPVAVADFLKIPSIIFHTSAASYLRGYLAIPRLNAEGYFPLQDSMLLEPVPELYPLRFKDLPLSRALAMEDTLQLIEIWSSIRTSSAIIWNTMDYLEQPSLIELQQHYQVPVFAVGPLHVMAQVQSSSLLKEDKGCISWLDQQAPKSVIYVCFGTEITLDEKELVETAWGLANCDQPFLWVVRPGSVLDSEWIELLPEGFSEKIGKRGCIVKWAPQTKVLAHGAVGGYLSHCGWNSTLESISEGVPMICRARSIDQRVNARYACYVWKVGLELNRTLERGEIERAIKRLLVDKEGEELRQTAIDLKEKVKACVSEGGSSYNSVNDLAQFLSS